MMRTRIVRHGDADSFLKRAGPWLLRSEVENSLVLGIASSACEDGRPLYAATVEHGDAVVGCALRTPPRKLVVTRMPPGTVCALAVDVAACYDELPAVHGPVAAAREFAYHWCARRDCTARDGMSQRLYRLDHVQTPDDQTPGELRFATERDTGLVASWIACFTRELGVDVAHDREYVAARIAAREIACWWDGHPRSLAGYVGRSPTGVRIGYVYTPPEWRGRGYAGACVRALSQQALDDGAAFCCLYTDLANPVSNTLYQRIGYLPVTDAMDVDFLTRES